MFAILDLPPSPDLSRQQMSVISVIFALFSGVFFLISFIALLLSAETF